MAKNDKNMFQNNVSDQEENQYKRSLDSVNDVTTYEVDGVTRDFVRENEEDNKELESTIRGIANRYKSVTDDNIVEFFSRNAMNHELERNKMQSAIDRSNRKIDITKILQDPSNGAVNELFTAEKSRIKKLDDYDKILDHIPQIAQALKVIVNNIMSPDDFTKNVFTLFYDDKEVTSDKSREGVRANLNELERKYNVESRTKNIVTDTLKYGDQFISVLKLDKEFSKMFNESGDFIFEDDSTLINESTLILSESDEKELERLILEEDSEYKGNVRQDIVNMINENIEFTKDTSSIFREEILMESDFSSHSGGVGSIDISKWEDNETKKNLEKSKSRTYSNRKLFTKLAQRGQVFQGHDNPLIDDIERAQIDHDKKNKKDNGYITGSYIKTLDPRKVVKIYKNGVCYGYYHCDSNYDSLNLTDKSNSLAVASNFQIKSGVDIGEQNGNGAGSRNLDPKSKLILDVFMRNIAKKLDKKFIEKNEQFKEMIFTLMQEDFITKKKVSITFLPPEEVVHFKINENINDGYGRSVFDDVLWLAKIYLAVLTTTIMMKLARSADHRTFYLETGLSNEMEGVIQDFIREIKAKEVKMSDLNSIDTILNSIGQFQDFYIPTVEGSRAVDIDVTPGQQVDMENDFLDFLKKGIISGMGVPSSFLQYSDEMEFARSVSMTNGGFLIMIIGYQKSLAEGFSEIYRLLYKNEFGENVTNTDDENEGYVLDYDSITARFPSPSTLNMSNLVESIGSVQTIVEFQIETIVGTQEQDEVKRDYLKREFTKKAMPNIDWAELQSIADAYEIDKVELRLKADLEQNPVDFSADQGAGMDGGAGPMTQDSMDQGEQGADATGADATGADEAGDNIDWSKF